MTGPLAGIRILEIGHMLAGPYCGLLLADLGADVVKIEPATGDIARRISPHKIGPHNAYFASLNRNKRSVVIDLRTDAGALDQARGIAATAAQQAASTAGTGPLAGAVRRHRGGHRGTSWPGVARYSAASRVSSR